MGQENFQEEPVHEQVGPTPEEQKVQRDDSRARKVLTALGAALGVTIANQAPVTDLHQQQPPSLEHTQSTNAKESPKPWRQDGTKVTIDVKAPITNVDLTYPTKNIDLSQKVKNIKLPE